MFTTKNIISTTNLLRFYLTLTLNAEASYLSLYDLAIIGSSILFIGVVWTMNLPGFNQSETYGYFALSISCISFTFAMFALGKKSYSNYSRLSPDLINPESAMHYMKAAVASRNLYCTKVILLVFPFFAVTYFLAFFGIISNYLKIYITSILNFIAKIVFVLSVMDGHVEV